MSKGKIQVFIPEWFTGVASISGNPVCSPVSSQMSALMSCSFSSNILYVTNPVTTDQKGTEITFQVTGYRNPYNAKPKSGFIITTTDENNGAIDSSVNIAKPPTMTVTGFAQFSLVTVDRSTGGETTVGALSSLDFLVVVGLPMDVGCKLKIKFPSDMPLTDDFYQVLGAGFA